MSKRIVSAELKFFTEKFELFFRKNIASGTYIIYKYLKKDYDFLLYIMSSKPGRWNDYITENVRYTLFKNLPSETGDVSIPKYLRKKIFKPRISFSHTGENIVRMFEKSEGLKKYCKEWFKENYYKEIPAEILKKIEK
ncbi:MAG: hypothetical protein U0469_03035 [Candidatus Paceibacterota bacterium]|jgi:hypothetical protein